MAEERYSFKKEDLAKMTPQELAFTKSNPDIAWKLLYGNSSESQKTKESEKKSSTKKTSSKKSSNKKSSQPKSQTINTTKKAGKASVSIKGKVKEKEVKKRLQPKISKKETEKKLSNGLQTMILLDKAANRFYYKSKDSSTYNSKELEKFLLEEVKDYNDEVEAYNRNDVQEYIRYWESRNEYYSELKKQEGFDEEEYKLEQAVKDFRELSYINHTETSTALYKGMNYSTDDATLRRMVSRKVKIMHSLGKESGIQKMNQIYKDDRSLLLKHKRIIKIEENIKRVQNYLEKYNDRCPKAIVNEFNELSETLSPSLNNSESELKTMELESYKLRKKFDNWVYRKENEQNPDDRKYQQEKYRMKKKLINKYLQQIDDEAKKKFTSLDYVSLHNGKLISPKLIKEEIIKINKELKASPKLSKEDEELLKDYPDLAKTLFAKKNENKEGLLKKKKELIDELNQALIDTYITPHLYEEQLPYVDYDVKTGTFLTQEDIERKNTSNEYQAQKELYQQRYIEQQIKSARGDYRKADSKKELKGQKSLVSESVEKAKQLASKHNYKETVSFLDNQVIKARLLRKYKNEINEYNAQKELKKQQQLNNFIERVKPYYQRAFKLANILAKEERKEIIRQDKLARGIDPRKHSELKLTSFIPKTNLNDFMKVTSNAKNAVKGTSVQFIGELISKVMIPNIKVALVLPATNTTEERTEYVSIEKYKERLSQLKSKNKNWIVLKDVKTGKIKEFNMINQKSVNSTILTVRKYELKPMTVPQDYIKEGVVDNYIGCILAAMFFQLLVSNTPMDEDYYYIERKYYTHKSKNLLKDSRYMKEEYSGYKRANMSYSEYIKLSKNESNVYNKDYYNVLAQIADSERQDILKPNTKDLANEMKGETSIYNIHRFHKADDIRVRDFWIFTYKGVEFLSGSFDDTLFEKKADSKSIQAIAKIMYERTKNITSEHNNFTYKNTLDRWKMLEYGGYKQDSSKKMGAKYAHGVKNGHSYQAPRGFLRLTEAYWNMLAESEFIVNESLTFFKDNDFDVSKVETKLIKDLTKKIPDVKFRRYDDANFKELI